MHAASRMELDMVLDSPHGHLFLLGLVWGWLVEVDRGIDCFSRKEKWRLGVNHHRWFFLSDRLDHALGNAILIVSVGRTWFVRCTTSTKHQSDGFVAIFSAAIIAPTSFHFVSYGINSGLK